jgi:hypothetical protein
MTMMGKEGVPKPNLVEINRPRLRGLHLGITRINKFKIRLGEHHEKQNFEVHNSKFLLGFALRCNYFRALIM